jgi:hypothetical protein
MKSHESHNTDKKSKMTVGIAKIDGKNTINTIKITDLIPSETGIISREN